MKTRFWQKTYLLTLVLFLLCMNMGILYLTFHSYERNIEAVETSVKSEQAYVLRNFEWDYRGLDKDERPLSLMQSYGYYYQSQGAFLAFEKDGAILTSTIAGEYSINPNMLKHSYINGKRYVLISSTVCGGEYEMIFAKDVSSLDKELKALITTYITTDLIVSVVLALVLYFALKRLSLPLEKLRRTTELIQNGDYTVLADEKGKDEFAHLAKSFNTMIAKIDEQMKTLEQDGEKKQMLIDNLAHELRTPLTGIYGYAEYLEKADVSEDSRIDAAGWIMNEAKRLQKISELLLDSAFIRGNQPEMTKLDMSTVLSEVCDSLGWKAENAGVSLIYEGAETRVNGNKTLLSMLFYNLADNAIKACGPGGRVLLSCDGKTATVEDNGKGMTAEQLLHITEPFYRTDKSRSRSEGGAGLGLTLCKQIADNHHALLHFVSEEGKGTKAIVDFTTLI